MICPLCRTPETPRLAESGVKADYFLCPICDLRFLNPALRLEGREERQRYLKHNNVVTDPAYQKFVEPLYQAIRARTSPRSWGLDYGAGKGPVLTHLLEKDGYKVSLYDPFFWPDTRPLTERFDFIFATEVVEHFFEPRLEFERFKKILVAGGLLAIMTLLYDDKIDFQNWYYRRDPTHVSFYSRKTFQWIAAEFGFREPAFSGERIVLLA